MLKRLIFTVCLCAPMFIWALDYTRMTLPVDSRADADRQVQFQTALSQAFVKASANPEVLNHAQIQSSLKKAQTFVTQYHYDKKDDQLMLVLQLDETMIRQALESAQFSVWEGYRPTTLMWIGADLEGRRLMITQNETDVMASLIREQLKRIAQSQGVQIIFPVGDLSELQAVTPSDIWGGFDARILEASSRYKADGVSIVKLEAMPGNQFRLRYTTTINRENRVGFTPSADLNATLQQFVQATGRLASEMYVPEPEKSTAIKFVVTGLDDVQTYARVSAYLQRQQAVEALSLSEFSIPEAVFDIKLKDKLATFERSLALEGLLVPDASINIEGDDTVVYRPRVEAHHD